MLCQILALVVASFAKRRAHEIGQLGELCLQVRVSGDEIAPQQRLLLESGRVTEPSQKLPMDTSTRNRRLLQSFGIIYAVVGDFVSYHCSAISLDNWNLCWFKNPANQLRMVVYPVINRVLPPSQVVVLGISEPSTASENCVFFSPKDGHKIILS